MNPSIPEEAIVDAVLLDPLAAAALLLHLANSNALSMRTALLDDVARGQNITSQKLDSILTGLLETGLLSRMQDALSLTVSQDEALRYAAVLRGVAYSRYRHRDSNQIEITLSPPAHPSRLMEILPKQGFSWTGLYNTKDSLIELASQAERRLVIVSPFLDREGLEWIGQLFDTTAQKSIKRTMIVRGRDQTETDLFAEHGSQLAAKAVDILSYAISHDPALRNPAIETFHAKILLADDDKAYIGSANMTRWSRDFSLECGVILRGPCVKPVACLVEAMIRIGNSQI
jgi:phosphatidylserine/phosphatidylglycerophosphate/cardiolipin synthase-like enzyme